MRRIPSTPRCKMCWAPFEWLGGGVLRHFGFGRYWGNPSLCNYCISQFHNNGVTGATIPVTLLFADIRGSTGIGERLSPTEFHTYLERFYGSARQRSSRSTGWSTRSSGTRSWACSSAG